MVGSIVSKYKTIITLILFCFFQTNPSISFGNDNHNYIYYSDVINDKYFGKIGFFKSGKDARKINDTNYSYIVKSPDKDYEVEYIAAFESEKEDGGWTYYYGNFTATNLKTGKSKTYKFSTREDDPNFIFLESSFFIQSKISF
jgi:hypothetical protein